MDKHAASVHRKKLHRAERQRIKRHETFVAAHGNLARRQAKNLAKYPSLAEPDKRPSIRGKDWVAPVEVPMTKEQADAIHTVQAPS